MKILITGGTGFLGRRLAKEAVKRGAQVAVFSHNTNDEFRQLGINVIAGDILNREQLKNAFAGYDVVYHLAAELDESSPDLWQVNVEGTRNVVNACKASGVKRLIFASAIGVLGESSTPLSENAPYAPETKYEKSKAAAEKLVASSGVPYTIARMPPILGPNKIWQQIFHAAQKNYPIIGSGNNYWPLVYADDVTEVLLKMLRPAARDRIYNIANEDNHTYLEVYQTIAKVIEVPEPKKHVPVWLANFAALLYETKCRIFNQKPNVTKMRASIARLTRNRPVNIEKAKKEIGYAPKYNLEEGLKKTWEELKIS